MILVTVGMRMIQRSRDTSVGMTTPVVTALPAWMRELLPLVVPLCARQMPG